MAGIVALLAFNRTIIELKHMEDTKRDEWFNAFNRTIIELKQQ